MILFRTGHCFFIALFLLLMPASLFSVDIFWDSQRVIVPSNARFHSAASGGGNTAVVWHEFVRQDADRGIIFLSIATSSDGIEWFRNERFAGPFSYAGDEVSICSLAVNNNGEIFVAASVSANSVKIFKSSDNGRTFTYETHQASFAMAIGPRLFIKEDGTFIMFVTQEVGSNLSIFYSLSDDGMQWGEFRQLVSGAGFTLNFLPHFVSRNNVEYVIFQSLLLRDRLSSFQLYLMRSTDGGRTWRNLRRITDFSDPGPGTVIGADEFDNQRPHFIIVDDTIRLVWERRNINETNSQIYFATLDLAGNLIGTAERISRGNRICRYPRVASYMGTNVVTWFDNRRGDYSIIFASYTGVTWRERDLSAMAGNSTFGQMVEVGDALNIFWENRIGTTSRVVMVSPKTEVITPVITPLNFAANRRASIDRFEFSWNLPPDPVGIAGFSYSVGRDRNGEPPRRIMNTARQLRGEVTVREDGPWYIYLAAVDYAGNWSPTAVMPIFRDTQPPDRLVLEEFETDDNGFLLSNNVRINWLQTDDKPLTGFIYNLQLLDENFRSDVDDGTFLERIRNPEMRNLINPSFINRHNMDNGIWGFSVAAVDEAGNIGEPVQTVFRLNKYVPVTFITSISAVRDQLDRITISISGRGFSVGGNIHTIILDRDGQEPWDYTFYLREGAYNVQTDRLITDLTVFNIQAGEYRIGVIHPTRGLYFSRPVIRLEPSGNVKFGYFLSEHETIWKPVNRRLFTFNIGGAGFYLILALSFLVVFVSAFRIRATFNDGKQLEKDIYAIMKGIPISNKKIKEDVKKMKRRGMGLRLKFTLFVVFIIIAVVLMIALPLGRFMLDTQKNNLVTGLQRQVEVLLDNITHNARLHLPGANMIELGLLPLQREAIPDAKYVTITSRGLGNAVGHDFLWVSDDPDIFSKINAREIVPGRDRVSDPVSAMIEELEERINNEAAERVLSYSHEVDRLGREAIALVGIAGREAALQELQNQIREYDQVITRLLRDIGRVIYSHPPIDLENYDIEDRVYIFYKPIIFRQPGEDTFFRGVVRLGVSTSSLLAEVRNSNMILVQQTLVIATIAVVFGIIAALILSTVIIRPIRMLVKGLEVIRDTEDKETLKNHVIKVKSKDEIFLLAETVNQMTEGLVKAAAASKELTVGKDVQKMFIPLEKDDFGNKFTTGKQFTDKFEYFGYYEGAKGVSGDYFDYLKLDEDNFVLIKCDVAGKGVPASLIMVEVATIFLSYFKRWKSNQKINLPEVIININDMLEERGFKGRFATLVIVLVNVATGESYICNAGDKIVHFYSKKENMMKQVTLPDAPASGVFPSIMVAEQFKQVKMKVEKGDAFILFTDGIEESKRMFRDSNFQLIKCTGSVTTNDKTDIKKLEHGNHYVGSGDEEFGLSRVYDVLNAVFRKSTYRLEKYHNPIENEQLTFDFTLCEGTMEEAIMAMVSVERVFRVLLDPAATKNNKISVDIKVDDFLKKHFDQYRRYFAYPVETTDKPRYVVFSNLKEDEQYDDLTILAFRRK
ncbi:MAG: SpoIIE family protein phosphatase [Spirochaetes bacterium]|nr:SpoIIE family protein phosphatase [Spirochaetota bacterium]